jgi:hypothetical protein
LIEESIQSNIREYAAKVRVYDEDDEERDGLGKKGEKETLLDQLLDKLVVHENSGVLTNNEDDTRGEADAHEKDEVDAQSVAQGEEAAQGDAQPEAEGRVNVSPEADV